MSFWGWNLQLGGFRRGGLLPAGYPSSTQLWLYAGDTNSITDTSDVVDTWSDKSGNEHVASAVGTGPDTGANTINGNNVLTFDGTSSGEPLSISTLSITGDWTFAISLKATSSLPAIQYLFSPNGERGLFVEFTTEGDSWGFIPDAANEDIISASSDLSQNDAYVLTVKKSGTSYSLYQDGDLKITATSDDCDFDANFLIGGRDSGSGIHYFGQILEIVVCDEALADSQREALERRLGSNAGVSVLSSYTTTPISQSSDLVTTKEIPENWDYSRASSGTYFDSSGVLQTATTNVPRFDHDPYTGRSLGLLMENDGTNLQIRSEAISNGNGTWSESGFAFATSAASFLDGTTNGRTWTGDAGAGPKNIRTASDIDYTSGGVYTHSIYVQNTGCDKVRLVNPLSTGEGANFELTGDGVIGAVTSGYSARIKRCLSGWYRIEMTFTAGSTVTSRGIYLAMLADINTDSSFQSVDGSITVTIAAAQVEANEFASSYIATTTSTASRSRDIFSDNLLVNQFYFNETAATIGVRVKPYGIGDASNQYVLYVSEGTDLQDYYSLYITGNTNKSHYTGETANVGTGNQDLSQGAVLEQEQPYAITFGSGEITYIAGGDTSTVSATLITGIDRVYIGSLAFGNTLYGHVQKVYVSNDTQTPAQITANLYSSLDKGGIAGGQSNMEGWFGSSVSPNNNTGERQARETLLEFYDATNPFIVNGATNGSAAIYDSVSSPTANAWYDPDEDVFGSAYDKWEAAAQGFINGGGTVEFLLWDQGESDSTQPEADYYNALVAIFAKMRTVVGNVPIFIIPIGRKTSTDSYQSLRNAQIDLANNLTDVYRCPEKFHLALGDAVHLADASYTTVAENTMKFVLATLGYSVTSPIYAPVVDSVSRSGTTVTVNITHGSGSDISPSTGIEGFVYFKAGPTEVTINSAVRTDADTITLTLDEDVAGTLYYGYNAMHTVDPANLVVDDNGYPLYSFVEEVS